MPEPGEGPASLAVGVRATYDAVASAYDEQLADELDHKPLDRALLTAFLELAGKGTVADVGCGPGHVTRWIAERHADVVGIDLSPAMIDIARTRAPELTFTVGSMLSLPAKDAAWAGAVALYSIIHLGRPERLVAFAELARALRPGGSLLVSFHVDSSESATGETVNLTTWFGRRVEIGVHFLDPGTVTADLQAAGFTLTARLDRAPVPDHEFPSRRCYLLAQR